MLELVVVFGICALTSAQNFETGDNSTVTGCSSHCSMNDGDLTCWNKTLHFYEKILLAELRHYVAVQVNIALRIPVMGISIRLQRTEYGGGAYAAWSTCSAPFAVRNRGAIVLCKDDWHKRHDQHYLPNFGALKNETILAFQSALREDDIINSTTISAVAGALIDRVEEISHSTLSRMPHFSCPLPCEYRSNLWRNLFIASSILNVGLLLAVIPFIRSMIVSDSGEPLIK